jgi:ribosomal protein S18 acetylase RimI-like enzyme
LSSGGLTADQASLRIRPARPEDGSAIWSILGPTIRAGETYALDPGMSEADALAYWLADDKATFVAEHGAAIVGTYYLRANQSGPGSHVSNCGYMTGAAAAGKGVARAMCAHSLDEARSRGFRAMQFNFVVSTNERAVRLWQSMGFAIVGRLPEAFRHPRLGFVEALVMHRAL